MGQSSMGRSSQTCFFSILYSIIRCQYIVQFNLEILSMVKRREIYLSFMSWWTFEWTQIRYMISYRKDCSKQVFTWPGSHYSFLVIFDNLILWRIFLCLNWRKHKSAKLVNSIRGFLKKRSLIIQRISHEHCCKRVMKTWESDEKKIWIRITEKKKDYTHVL